MNTWNYESMEIYGNLWMHKTITTEISELGLEEQLPQIVLFLFSWRASRDVASFCRHLDGFQKVKRTV